MTVAAEIGAQHLEYLGDDALRVEPGLGVHRFGAILIEKYVGKDHRPDLEAPFEQPCLRQGVQDVRAEAADRPFLHGDQDFVFAGQLVDQLEVQRFGKSRIRDGGREPEFGQLGRSLRAFGETRAERQKRDLVALADDASLADFERDARFGNGHADPVAARIPHGRRPIVDGDRGGDHMGEFALVRRGHDDEAGEATEVGDVE